MRLKLQFFIIFTIFIVCLIFVFPERVNAGCRLTDTGHTSDRCSGPGQCWENCDILDPCDGREYVWKYIWTGACVDGWCEYKEYKCTCPAGCGGCFVEGTEINTEQESERAGEQERIENLQPGEIVSSFNPETGEISESQVAEVHKITREGYYELETESGKKVKVTGEHPFLAVKSEENLISKLKNVLSNTLTYRLITSLQTKLIEVLD